MHQIAAQQNIVVRASEYIIPYENGQCKILSIQNSIKVPLLYRVESNTLIATIANNNPAELCTVSRIYIYKVHST